MTLGALKFELYLPEARSLKDKRRIVRSVIDRLRARFNVAVAEVEYQEKRQRAGIGVGAVGSSDSMVREVLEKIVRTLRAPGPFILSNHEIELF